MTNKQILKRYSELKEKGVASMKKNNHGEVVVVVKKFDEDTGEAVKTKTYKVDKNWVAEQKKKAKVELQTYKDMEADFDEADKEVFEVKIK